MNTKLILSLSLFAVLLMSVISFDDAYAKDDKKEKQTKLQKECAKDPKSDDKIKAHCELLGLINDADAGTSDPRTDSFFDVFFDVFTVDSFFDIFTELQTQSHDKYTDQEAIDAVGLHTVDADTTYSGADFAVSDQNCAVGNVVTGIDENGAITCVLDETGTSGDTSALESRIAFLESISNEPPTITDFEIIVDKVVRPNRVGTSYIHDCTINWSYTIHDDQRWLPLTIHYFGEDGFGFKDDFVKTVQQESLSLRTNISDSFNYEYNNSGFDFTNGKTLSVTIDDGGAGATETQDFRC